MNTPTMTEQETPKRNHYIELCDVAADTCLRLNALTQLVAYHPELQMVDAVGLGGLIELINKELATTLHGE